MITQTWKLDKDYLCCCLYQRESRHLLILSCPLLSQHKVDVYITIFAFLIPDYHILPSRCIQCMITVIGNLRDSTPVQVKANMQVESTLIIKQNKMQVLLQGSPRTAGRMLDYHKVAAHQKLIAHPSAMFQWHSWLWKKRDFESQQIYCS